MLRKFPPQTLFSNPKNQNQFMQMNQMFPNQFGGNQNQHQHQQPNFGNFPPQQMPQNLVDPSLMNPNDRKDFFGDQLYTKISSNMNLSQFEE